MSYTLKRSLALLRTESAMRDDNLFRGALSRSSALITVKARDSGTKLYAKEALQKLRMS